MIELRNIGFSYGNEPLIEGVSFTVAPNDFVGIVGENGSGKSTLIKIILGLLKPCKGDIVLRRNGNVVSSLSIGYLPQYSSVDRQFPLSVRETVALGLLNGSNYYRTSLNARERIMVDEALATMNITHIAHKQIAALSGGELQRTFLARAIVCNPELLILDEPNTYLDSRSESALYDILPQLNERCAIILVGHDIDNIRKMAKKVVSL